MTVFHPRLRALLVGAGAIALVTIGAGGTLAASTTPPVWACYNTTGQVAMSSSALCKLAGGGQLVQINAQGIPGATGPTGATGATGATGQAGGAQAWGAIGLGGDVVFGQGIAGVQKIGTGVYCVGFAGIRTGTAVAMVTPFGGSDQRIGWNAAGGVCSVGAADGVQVSFWDASAPGLPLRDAAFYIAIP